MYRLNTKIRLTVLCLSGFELYSRRVNMSQDHYFQLRFTYFKSKMMR